MLSAINFTQQQKINKPFELSLNKIKDDNKTLCSNYNPPFYSPVFKSHTTIHPKFTEKYIRTIQRIITNKLDKFELTQHLSHEEQKELIKYIGKDDKAFVNLLLDEKPVTIIYGKHNYLKNTHNFDILRQTNSFYVNNQIINVPNTIILNKKESLKLIDTHKDIYILRLGIDKNATSDEIYAALTAKNGPLLKNDKHDLIGISLGFSPINSILFQLEKDVYGKNFNARKNVGKYREDLLNYFKSDRCCYKNLPIEQIENIEQNIQNIGQDKNTFMPIWNEYGFGQINIVTDDNYNQSMIRRILRVYEKGNNIS